MTTSTESAAPVESWARRAPKFVDEANWNYFHKKWRAIDELWPHFFDAESLAHADVIDTLRECARDALRAEMRSVVSIGRAMYLIPV